ncbi:MAG: signal peptidase II [Armatimonadetes bacterium]|nr:signal peptidase II [Armatimonadota bacterium]NIM24146.1 signal peptidase II [Armatimonadota bacterium]NIM68005.1 signal peptidase II [Armatimonadota bacterium]NIM76500.1 signal peptidase II [Armatimonadota bacterium]NIN06239.1 signal peptidase II [Armatimonadota bacterium]
MRCTKSARSRLSTALLVGLLTILADQCSKLTALHFLSPGEPVNLIGQVLRLNLTYNPGMAFGLQVRGVLYLVLLGVFLFLILMYLVLRRSRSSPAFVVAAIGLGLGGAVSNLIDRLRLGAVIDYIDLSVWPVFNVADIALTAAAILLALHLAVARKSLGDNQVESSEL